MVESRVRFPALNNEHMLSNQIIKVMTKQMIEFPTLTTAQCRVIEDKVIAAWERRAKVQGYNKTKQKTKDLQAEFLLGMTAALDVLTLAEESGQSSISPRILFSIIRGEYIE